LTLVANQAVTPLGLTAILDGSAFVDIPAGEFLMGSDAGVASEQPVHRIRISTAFQIGKFEVTQGQWVAVMATAHPTTPRNAATGGEAPGDSNPSHFKGLGLPVEMVSWHDVQRFLAALNARDPTHVYRLPTEAEWEYAARAGRASDVDDLDRLAWFDGNSGGQTHPVGQKEPNAWGLHDVHGNVSEWVSDWYAPDYYENSPAVDPPGPESGSYRIYRGCPWFGRRTDCRSALRTFNFPNDGQYSVGFRLVRTPRK
jgi:formylglycine-generating enzyme required for sulfatase activity